nr:TRAP transporter small permease [Agrobacterium deltaense]
MALFMIAMVAMVFGNVVLRYGFNSGIAVSEELSRWLFVWIVFLGAIVALYEHGHLGVNMLVKRLPTSGKRACVIASHVLMIYATWLILRGSWDQTMLSLDVPAPVSGLSTAWFYSVGVVFGASAGVILLSDLFKVLTGRITDGDLVLVKESEEEEEWDALQAEIAARDRGDVLKTAEGSRT